MAQEGFATVFLSERELTPEGFRIFGSCHFFRDGQASAVQLDFTLPFTKNVQQINTEIRKQAVAAMQPFNGNVQQDHVIIFGGAQ